MNRRMPRGTRAAGTLAAAAIAGVLLACSGGSSEQPTSFAGSDGANLYSQACARCHGADLRGTNQGPPFLDAIYRPGHHADGAFLFAVRGGSRAHHWNFGNMPPIPGLTDEQVGAITGFVREQQRAAGIE